MNIYLYTDLKISPGQLFWHRDLGLLTKDFRSLGHDAWLVVHPATEPNATPVVPNKLDLPREQPCVAQQGLPRLSVAGPDSPLPTFAPSHLPTSADSNIKHPTPKILDAPVIWASPSDVRNPFWWQSRKPDLVILGLWTRPKYDPIRRAALSATARVIERADSDGMRTASCGLINYAKRRFDYFRDRTYRWPAFLSAPASVLYSLASILATPWIETRLAKTLKLLPALTVETPQANELWEKLAIKLGVGPTRIHFIPHPVQTDIFKPDPAISKKKQIISVGRWNSYQKNLPLLIETLTAFLRDNPSWTALIVGSGLSQIRPHPGIFFSSPLTPAELARRMQESKVVLSTSRYESFGLAIAEALCCGCTPCGPDELDSLVYFDSIFMNRNLPACRASLCERLSIISRQESPQGAAEKAGAIFSPHKIAGEILNISKNLRRSKPIDSSFSCLP